MLTGTLSLGGKSGRAGTTNPPLVHKGVCMSEVCVFDFCGYTKQGHFPVSFWADYNTETKQTVFGGDWSDVPPMMTDDEPTEEAVAAWAAEFAEI